MVFCVFIDDLLIGTSELEYYDGGTGFAFGKFNADRNYIKFKALFRSDPRHEDNFHTLNYIEKRNKYDKYYAQFEKLNFYIVDEEGNTVPINFIDLEDWSEEFDEMTLTIQVPDCEIGALYWSDIC